MVPAAHYFCGGVEAAVDGVTALPGLYACGEVTCTGLHGANRLASNSLLEAAVCAAETVKRVLRDVCEEEKALPDIPAWQYGNAVASDEEVVVEHNWDEVRRCMWDYVGIVRTNKRLERAMRRIRNLRIEIGQYYLDYLVTPDVLELRNLAGCGGISGAVCLFAQGEPWSSFYPGLSGTGWWNCSAGYNHYRSPGRYDCATF